MSNCTEEVAVEIELLNSTIFAVSHIKYLLPVDLNRVWKVKRPGGCASLAPLFHPLSLRRVFEDPGVAVAIGDEEASIRSEGDIGGSVELAPVVRLLTYTDGRELLTYPTILA